jgi:hypothetical protein
LALPAAAQAPAEDEFTPPAVERSAPAAGAAEIETAPSVAEAAPAVAAPSVTESAAAAATPAVAESVPVVADSAEPPPPARGYLYHPSGPRSGGGKTAGFRVSLGMLFDAVDSLVLQGFHAPVPQFTLNGRYQFGGDSGFSLLAQFQFIWVMNQLELGVGWSSHIGNTGVMLYLNGGSLIGTLNQGGFQTFTASPMIRPGIRLGWEVSDYRITFDGSAVFIPAQYVALGSNASVWTSEFSPFTGLQGTVTLETPLSGGGIVYCGVGAMWMRSWYQTWLFFSDNPALLLYPRLFGGYVF